MDEKRVETLARQHGIRQKRDDGGVAKTLTAFLRRAEEGTLSRLMVETSILIAASRGNPSAVLHDAATAYKVEHRGHLRQDQAGVRCKREGEKGCAACNQDH
jgi:ParB family chromosome partitioning protein